MRHLRHLFWDTLYLVTSRLQRVRCWFIDHDECWGSRYDREPDYCSRCYVEWPQDKRTLPSLLNKGYIWMVEKDWRWFDALDEWLLNSPRTRRHLPNWWCY